MKTIRYSVSLTVINLAARGSYFLVFLIVGNVYGSTSTTDAVFLMYAPVAIVATVIAGICEIVVMPFAHRAHKLQCTTTFRRLLITRTLVATLWFAPVVLAASFAVSGTVSTTVLLLLPIPSLAALSGIHAHLLNAAGRFRIAASGPVYGALAAGCALFVLPLSEIGLAFTLLGYELGRALGLYTHAMRSHRVRKDSAPGNASPLFTQTLKAMWRQGAGSLLVALNPLVDMLFAKTLSPGAVSSVEYANRMWVIIPLLFSGPLMLFHSRASVDASQSRLLYNAVRREAIQLGVVALGAGAILIWLAQQWLVDWLYGWGRMSIQAKGDLADLFSAYLLGTAPYVASLICVRALSATTQIHFITRAAAVSVVLNAALDWLMIRFFGLTGLGLATSLTYLAVATYLYLVLRGNPLISVSLDEDQSRN